MNTLGVFGYEQPVQRLEPRPAATAAIKASNAEPDTNAILGGTALSSSPKNVTVTVGVPVSLTVTTQSAERVPYHVSMEAPPGYLIYRKRPTETEWDSSPTWSTRGWVDNEDVFERQVKLEPPTTTPPPGNGNGTPPPAGGIDWGMVLLSAGVVVGLAFVFFPGQIGRMFKFR